MKKLLSVLVIGLALLPGCGGWCCKKKCKTTSECIDAKEVCPPKEKRISGPYSEKDVDWSDDVDYGKEEY